MTNYPSTFGGGVQSQQPLPSYSEQQKDQYRNDLEDQPQRQAVNRGSTYATNAQQQHPPPPAANQKRRVQIVDHSRQTPSTVHNDYAPDKQSHNSTNGHFNAHQTPTSEMNRPKPAGSHPHPERSEENRHGYHPGQNSNTHEYLYGLAAPDPGK